MEHEFSHLWTFKRPISSTLISTAAQSPLLHWKLTEYEIHIKIKNHIHHLMQNKHVRNTWRKEETYLKHIIMQNACLLGIITHLHNQKAY